MPSLMTKIHLWTLYLLLALICVAPVCAVNAAENAPDIRVAQGMLEDEQQSDTLIQPTEARFRLTFENVQLPANEKMGFMGGSFLYDMNDWLAVGAGSYGAMSGQRGGFITLGVAAELKQALSDNIEVNAGMFVGAGGGHGGFQLSGGGLMLRYHLGLDYKIESMGALGAGVSFIDFPDGTIHSTQPYVSYEYLFRTPILSGWLVDDEMDAPSMGRNSQAEQELAPILRSYLVPSGILTDSGSVQHARIKLVGFEWNRYLNDNVFLRIESLGAMGGKSRGYMQTLFGVGYRTALLDETWLKLALSAGMAGGGDVATGGGLLMHASVALQQRLSEHMYAELSAGYANAPDGNFKAYSLDGKLGYHFNTLDVSEHVETLSRADLSGFQPSHFRVRVAHQKYYKAASNWRDHHNDLNVGNLGVQMDHFITENFFLSGQGMAAYSGKAGAYMVGLIGSGMHWPLLKSPLFFEVEALIGPAGGGGLATGSGLVWQSNAGIGYQFSDNYSLVAQYGYMAAIQGNFKATVMTVSVASNFTLFTK